MSDDLRADAEAALANRGVAADAALIRGDGSLADEALEHSAVLAQIGERLAFLDRGRIRNRQLALIAIWVTVAQVILGVLLVFVGFVAIRGNAKADVARAVAVAAEATARANAIANHATCAAGNESRSDSIKLWESFIKSTPDLAPEAIATIRANVDATYLPLRDCDKVAPIDPLAAAALAAATTTVPATTPTVPSQEGNP